ncbi:MAG: aspartate/glutamate racemase family protein [Xanthobacteraceae bacterium]
MDQRGEGKLEATKRHRIWAQGATDQIGHRNYLAALLPHIAACTDPDFEVKFTTMTPSVTTVHALSEFRFSREVIRGAIEAERQGYDAFFMNHFQDVGLYEARAAVKIPVLGLGEATLLHACTMGRKLGLLAINPAFIPTHDEEIRRYGLQQRIAGMRAMDASINDYMEAFAEPAKKAKLRSLFESEARHLIEAGADVIVPTGGIPMMLFGKEPDANVAGAPIVNGITVVIKAAEMAVKLKRLGVPIVSRIPQSGFALPSAQTLDEFIRHG